MTPRTLVVLLGGWASAAVAGDLGYAQATGYFKQASRPTLYQPLNLLDGRDATAWCTTSADPLNEQVSFGFNGPSRLDELRVSNGNGFDPETWETFSRARKLVLHSGKDARTVVLEDTRGPQVLKLDPPLVGERFRLEVLDSYPADDPDFPVCLTDVVFVSEGKALNGPWLAPRLKYDRAAAALLGTWFAGFAGTPDRFWSFHFDGTFRYSYEPYDERLARPKVLVGTYDVSASRLVLELKGKRLALGLAREPRRGGGFELKLQGELPADLKGPWRSVP